MSDYAVIRVLQKLNLEEEDHKILAEAFAARNSEHFATKTDIIELKGEIKNLHTELKGDIAGVNHSLKISDWIAGIGVAVIGTILGAGFYQMMQMAAQIAEISAKLH